jgi:UDP-3-O-[3-hydroxymyristoyl] glucosamine N-acyltransferase
MTGATVELQGNVLFKSDLKQYGRTCISLGKNSKLRILGDFTLGPDVLIILGDDAELIIGGRKDSSGSGITGSTRIMVRESVVIGADTIIAWDVFITDSDWHTIVGFHNTKPTIIGSHVWLAHGASVLKGTTIGNDSIVAAKGTCMMSQYPPNSLLGGTPARILRRDVEWQR